MILLVFFREKRRGEGSRDINAAEKGPSPLLGWRYAPIGPPPGDLLVPGSTLHGRATAAGLLGCLLEAPVWRPGEERVTKSPGKCLLGSEREAAACRTAPGALPVSLPPRSLPMWGNRPRCRRDAEQIRPKNEQMSKPLSSHPALRGGLWFENPDTHRLLLVSATCLAAPAASQSGGWASAPGCLCGEHRAQRPCSPSSFSFLVQLSSERLRVPFPPQGKVKGLFIPRGRKRSVLEGKRHPHFVSKSEENFKSQQSTAR